MTALLVVASPASAMQRRSFFCQSITGAPIPACSITVYRAGTTTKATIYSDQAGSSSLGNPITAGTDGTYAYYAPLGRYTEVLSAPGFTFGAAQTQDFILFDPFASGGASVNWATAVFSNIVSVNVSSYGATGAGNTTCTGTDDTAALLAAYAALPSDGGTIFFPHGTYQLTSQITVTKFNTWFVGVGSLNNPSDGAAASMIVYCPASTGTAAIKFDGAAGGQRGGARYLALRQGNTTASTTGIHITGQQKTLIDVAFANFTARGLCLCADPAGSGDAIWNAFYAVSAQLPAGINNAVGVHLLGCAAATSSCVRLGGVDRVVNANIFSGLRTFMPTVANGAGTGLVGVKLEGPVSDNTFEGSDISPGDTGTGFMVGDGTNTCRGNKYDGGTIEGSAGSTNYNVGASCIGTYLHGFFTSAATATVSTSAQATWIFDTRTGQIGSGCLPVNLAAINESDVCLRNGRFIQGENPNRNAPKTLIGMDTESSQAFKVLLGASDTFPRIQARVANGSLPAAGANQDGILGVDTTNNQLVLFSGGNRYWLTAGTSPNTALLANGTAALPSVAALADPTTGIFFGTGILRLSIAGVEIARGASSGLNVTQLGLAGLAGGGTVLINDGTNIVAQKNSTSAQTFRVYGTTTGPKYVALGHDGSDANIAVTGGGAINLTATALNVNALPIATMLLTNASGTTINNAHMVQDTVTLVGGTAGVALAGNAAFTNSTSYTCVCDNDSAVLACRVVQNGGNGFTLSSGAGTDVVRFICVGN